MGRHRADDPPLPGSAAAAALLAAGGVALCLAAALTLTSAGTASPTPVDPPARCIDTPTTTGDGRTWWACTPR